MNEMYHSSNFTYFGNITIDNVTYEVDFGCKVFFFENSYGYETEKEVNFDYIIVSILNESLDEYVEENIEVTEEIEKELIEIAIGKCDSFEVEEVEYEGDEL